MYVYILLCAASNFLFDNVSGSELLPMLKGDPTKPGEIKYIVSINYNNMHVCGGAIVSDTHIVTAAHCFINESTNNFIDGPVNIIAGVNDLTVDDPAKVEVEVESMYVMKKYNMSTQFYNDLAVLKLKKSLNLKNNKNLMALLLPTNRSKFDNKRAVMSGFGWDEITLFGAGGNSMTQSGSSLGILYKSNMIVIPNSVCDKNYYDDITGMEMCAKMIKDRWARFYGVCNGDNGGPLVYKGKVLIGVYLASPLGCNEVHSPGIYARVSWVLHFLHNALHDDVANLRVHHFKTSVP